jgi:hypothetical protein
MVVERAGNAVLVAEGAVEAARQTVAAIRSSTDVAA